MKCVSTTTQLLTTEPAMQTQGNPYKAELKNKHKNVLLEIAKILNRDYKKRTKQNSEVEQITVPTTEAQKQIKDGREKKINEPEDRKI